MFLVSGCTLPLLQCFLKFTNFEKTYEFDFSKEELKNQIVEAYTYDKSLLLKNLGLTLIQNEKVNSEYRQNVDIWLDKKNWDEVKSEIRSNTTDSAC
jgi:soluble P-type ATPase